MIDKRLDLDEYPRKVGRSKTRRVVQSRLRES
jgi:hypothetical protein